MAHSCMHSSCTSSARLCILCVISGRRWIQCPKDNLCNLAEILMIQNSGTMPDKYCAEQGGKVSWRDVLINKMDHNVPLQIKLYAVCWYLAHTMDPSTPTSSRAHCRYIVLHTDALEIKLPDPLYLLPEDV